MQRQFLLLLKIKIGLNIVFLLFVVEYVFSSGNNVKTNVFVYRILTLFNVYFTMESIFSSIKCPIAHYVCNGFVVLTFTAAPQTTTIFRLFNDRVFNMSSLQMMFPRSYNEVRLFWRDWF